MSENLRNQPFENKGNADHCSRENRVRSDYEGFEGMNYEQRRPSYNPRKISSKKNDGDGSGKVNQGNEP